MSEIDIARSRELATPDGPMRLYEAAPDRPRAAVIVIMEAFGLNGHIEDVTRRLAAEGYHAVAPDLFHRAGGGTADYGDLEKVMALFEGVTIDGVERDLRAVLDDLAGIGFPPGNSGITGFCWGGWVAFLAAVRFRLGAAVTWYGGGIVSTGRLGFPALVDEVPGLHTPWLGLFGGLDQSIPGADLDRLQEALDRLAPAEHRIVRYPDADHGFHCDARPAVFHPEAAAAAWQEAITWFGSRLG